MNHKVTRMNRATRALAVTVALAMPSAALAAASPTEYEPLQSDENVRWKQHLAPKRTLLGGPNKPLEKAIDRVRESRPIHPVAASVDYGDALAAFGNARGRPHEGQDIFAPAGTKLVAPRAVTVLESGSDGGRGNWVALYDAQRKQTYSYFHLNAPAEVKPGEKLEAGDRVGVVGCTGSCSGDHLHFEIREGKGPYGEAIDPMPFLKRTQSVK